jgi:gamma-glutamylcyclotransferase (GGCT)/AIG2-like uncharacterized protein YtfP
MKKIFFYGTLKRGLHNFNLYVAPMIHTGQAKFLGEAVTRERLPLIFHTERNVPALYNAPDSQLPYVNGELWEVTDNALSALNIIEGVDEGFYSVGMCSVRLKETNSSDMSNDTQAIVYFKGANAEAFPFPGSGIQPRESHSIVHSELAAWIDKLERADLANGLGDGFLDTYTAEHHKKYTIKEFLPGTLAGATLRPEKEVCAFLDSKRTSGVCDGKSDQELSRLYASFWREFLGLET